MSVFLRDNSWYSTHGRAGRYHFEGKDCASACGKVRMLELDSPRDASNVPPILRCKARGCVEKWPKQKACAGQKGGG